MKNKQIVVLGGGPAGLCVAWNLCIDGYDVVVLEREAVCGGQSITFEKDGFRYDLGPHNIHSKHQVILDFLARTLKGTFTEHQIVPQIFFRGRRINYPLVGTQVLRSLPLTTSVLCGLSFVWTRFLSVFLPGYKDDGTYERWVVNRFGRRFFNIFFGPYSEKAWGIPCSEISDIVAKKRIAIRSLGELIRSVILRQESYHSENPRLIKQYYTKRGIGEVCNFFERGILEKGGRIIKKSEVTGLVLDKAGISQVEYLHDGKPETIQISAGPDPTPWSIISTLPVNELVLKLKGDVPPEVTKAAEGLDFTSEVFLYLNINVPDIWGVHLLYFSEAEFPFNRVYDVGLFSRDMVPPGKNALCLELTCSYGDKTWQMEEREIFERCIAPLEKHGLLRRDQIESYHVRRLKHAYPRFRVGYTGKLRTIFDYLGNVPNIVTFGRQGLFNYANVDDVIWMAFEVAKHMRYQERVSLTTDELLPDYIDF